MKLKLLLAAITLVFSVSLTAQNVKNNNSQTSQTSSKNATTVKATEFEYDTYFNERYPFSVDYPKLLTQQSFSMSGDGGWFYSPDSTVCLKVSGGYNMKAIIDSTLEQEYRKTLQGYGTTVTYKVLKSNMFVISGIKDGFVYYHITKWSDDHEVNAILTYPVADKKYYDKVCGVIYKSLKISD